jgi:hypothetical protein
VLARLTQTEARIELLEQGRLNQADANTTPIVHRVLQFSADDSRIPDLHTAAGHKILQYWPRLRVKLTIDLEPFTFLKTADHEDTFLTSLVLDSRQEFKLLPIIQSLDNLYENLSDLPLSFVDVLKASEYFSRDHILEPFYEAGRLNQPIFNLRECSIESLLVQTIAVSHMPAGPAKLPHPSPEACFKMALDSFWNLSSEPDEYAIPLTICFAQIFLYFFARPFHALGMLQGVTSAIIKFEERRSGDE